MSGTYDIAAQLEGFDAQELVAALRAKGYVIVMWSPADMVGFGDSSVPLEDRLEDCRKALEDCSEGWDVISSILGQNDDEVES